MRIISDLPILEKSMENNKKVGKDLKPGIWYMATKFLGLGLRILLEEEGKVHLGICGNLLTHSLPLCLIGIQ